MGAELDKLEEELRLIVRRGDRVRVPIFAARWEDRGCTGRWKRALEDGQVLQLPEIDRLHIALGLWQKGMTEELAALLQQMGVQDQEHPFWKQANAVLSILGQAADGNLEREERALKQMLGSTRSLLHRAGELGAEGGQLKLFE